MGFSRKQLVALRRNLDTACSTHPREPMAVSSPIWRAGMSSRKPTGSSVLMAGAGRHWNPAACLPRENRGTFLAIYIARVRITVHSGGATVIREGHGSGERRGTSPGEVHDIALKAAETDATKRALATFGKPFGLELYRSDKAAAAPENALPSPAQPPGRLERHAPTCTRMTQRLFRGHRATTAAGSLLAVSEHFRNERRQLHPDAGSATPRTGGARSAPRPHRQKRPHHRRTQAAARQAASKVRGLAALPDLRPATR